MSVMNDYPPRFIAIEGTDCSGKSSVIQGLVTYFKMEYGITPLLVRVPGGNTTIGSTIRGILVSEQGKALSPTVNALLYTADWRHTLETLVCPALEQGRVVIADRCNVSMAVYQRHSSYTPMLREITNDLIRPDKVIVLTTSYDTFIKRKELRGEDLNNPLDDIAKTEFNELREAYLQYAKETSDNVSIIDASQSEVDVLTDVILSVEEI